MYRAMKGAMSFLVPALLLLAVSASAVQLRPDFSGDWMRAAVLDGSSSDPARVMVAVGVPSRGVFEEISLQVDETTLTIVSENPRVSLGEDSPQVRAFSHPLDGSEQQWRITSPSRESRVTSTATWDGDRIVLRMFEAELRLDVEQVLVLDEAGRLMVTTTGTMGRVPSRATECFVRSGTFEPADWASNEKRRELAATFCQ